MAEKRGTYKPKKENILKLYSFFNKIEKQNNKNDKLRTDTK